MPKTIFALDKIPESQLIETIKIAGDDHADIVTAVNDKKGTFTVESTFFSGLPGGSPITLNGKMSVFGGPDDPGVDPDEGLSLFDARSEERRVGEEGRSPWAP